MVYKAKRMLRLLLGVEVKSQHSKRVTLALNLGSGLRFL